MLKKYIREIIRYSTTVQPKSKIADCLKEAPPYNKECVRHLVFQPVIENRTVKCMLMSMEKYHIMGEIGMDILLRHL